MEASLLSTCCWMRHVPYHAGCINRSSEKHVCTWAAGHPGNDRTTDDLCGREAVQRSRSGSLGIDHRQQPAANCGEERYKKKESQQKKGGRPAQLEE